MYRIALFSSTVISRSIRSITVANSLICRSEHHLAKPKIPNLIICSSTASSDALKKDDRKLTKVPKVPTDLPFEIEDDPEIPIINFNLKRKFQRDKNVEGGGYPVSYHYNPREYATDDGDDGSGADGGGDGGGSDGGGDVGGADGGGGDGGGDGGGGGDCGGF